MTTQGALIDSLLGGVPIVPVVVIEDAAHALPLVDALAAGGITAIEVTLRTRAALSVVQAIADARPNVIVGTGTVLSEKDLDASIEAGAKFAVSPGLTEALARAAQKSNDACPLLPGVATASEAMRAAEYGFERLKFFPAEQAGGVPYLKSLSGPLPHLKFCPTGGITPATYPDYAALGNTFTVGGSWIAPAALIAAEDWSAIEERAAAVARG